MSAKTTHPLVQEQTDAMLRIERHLEALDKAQATTAKRSAELDGVIASCVSQEPLSPYWYHHPGVLTPGQVMNAARLTENGLARVMARHRLRDEQAKPKAAPKRRRRRRAPARKS